MFVPYSGTFQNPGFVEGTAVAEKAIPVISAINSPRMNKQFVTYMQQELPGAFPADQHIHIFVAETEQRLLPAKTTTS